MSVLPLVRNNLHIFWSETMKKYYVSHERQHGFWIVALNNNGHYRSVARYTERNTAVKAAEALNSQEAGETQSALLAIL